MPPMSRTRVASACGLGLAAALLLAGCTMWKEKPVTAWSGATGGEQFERLLWQDVQAKNWNSVEQHLAATFVSVTASGTRDRAATLEHWKQLTLEEYSMGEVQVTPSGDLMIVTYSVTLKGSYAGQPLPAGPYRVMTIWQKEKKGWVATAHSATLAAAPGSGGSR